MCDRTSHGFLIVFIYVPRSNAESWGGIEAMPWHAQRSQYHFHLFLPEIQYIGKLLLMCFVNFPGFRGDVRFLLTVFHAPQHIVMPAPHNHGYTWLDRLRKGDGHCNIQLVTNSSKSDGDTTFTLPLVSVNAAFCFSTVFLLMLQVFFQSHCRCPQRSLRNMRKNIKWCGKISCNRKTPWIDTR